MSMAFFIFAQMFLNNKVKCQTSLSAICRNGQNMKKTLPKALRTQALTALTSNFGLVGLVQYAW